MGEYFIPDPEHAVVEPNPERLSGVSDSKKNAGRKTAQRHFCMMASVDRKWAIGKNGRTLASIPAGRDFFRRATMNRIVVMGRRTWESMEMRPLYDGRFCIVLSEHKNFRAPGAMVVHSIDEALELIDRLLRENELHDEDVAIIGGGSIYRQFLPYCDQALIAAIDYTYDADTDMPNLEKLGWKLVNESDEQTIFDLIYYYRLYRKTEEARNA